MNELTTKKENQNYCFRLDWGIVNLTEKRELFYPPGKARKQTLYYMKRMVDNVERILNKECK